MHVSYFKFRLDALLRRVALVSKMGSPALYRNPERADLVFTKWASNTWSSSTAREDWRMQREAERLAVRRSEAGPTRTAGTAGQDLHAGGYAFLSPLQTDENPTLIERLGRGRVR